MGERDLWDMIVNNDDICFVHILPRLNRSDVKFLYGVNSETRALIKRSSRNDELRKRFILKEMLSILTLEIAWENRPLWVFLREDTDFSGELLTRINSSCSSGYEKRKNVIGIV